MRDLVCKKKSENAFSNVEEIFLVRGDNRRWDGFGADLHCFLHRTEHRTEVKLCFYV